MWLTSSLTRRFARRLTSPRAKKRAAFQRTQKLVFECLEQRRLLAGGGIWVTGPSESLHETSGGAVFTVGGEPAGIEPATVEYRAVSGSASEGDDFVAITGTLTLAPGASAYNVTVPIVDDLLAEDNEGFYLELFNAVNGSIDVSQAEAAVAVNDHAPTIDEIGDQEVDEETELLFSVTASDPDQPQETLSYSLESGAPLGATINSETGEFSWTPHETDGPGVFEVTVRVTDSGSPALSTTQTFSITVNEVNLAPTGGLGNVSVDEDADDTVIELWPAFDDAEDTARNLSYSIEENSNPALFASASIDSSTGQLRLDYAENAFGTATLTVRATDSGGLSVETMLNVEVLAVNDAPVFSNFDVCLGQTGWCITGSVSDVDDDVTGWSISFGGILEGYSLSVTVGADGSFELFDELSGLAPGRATAWTFDPANVQSNIAECQV